MKSAKPDRIPKVSIIIPNYNHAPFLKQRIDSVLNQTHKDFELIILDDCSTDNSKEIIESYKSHPAITHIVYNEKNSGSPFEQWNKGLCLAEGEYVWIAESDDYCEKDFLSSLVGILENNKGMCLGYCQSWVVDQAGKRLYNNKTWTADLNQTLWENTFFMDGKKFVVKYMISKNAIPNASAVIFRRGLLEPESFPFLKARSMRMAGDWLFWIELLSTGDVAFIPSPLNFFRTHSGSTRIHDSVEKRKRRILEEGIIITEVSKLIPIKKRVLRKRLKINAKNWTDLFPISFFLKKEDFYQILEYFPITKSFLAKVAVISFFNRLYNMGYSKMKNLYHHLPPFSFK